MARSKDREIIKKLTTMGNSDGATIDKNSMKIAGLRTNEPIKMTVSRGCVIIQPVHSTKRKPKKPDLDHVEPDLSETEEIKCTPIEAIEKIKEVKRNLINNAIALDKTSNEIAKHFNVRLLKTRFTDSEKVFLKSCFDAIKNFNEEIFIPPLNSDLSDIPTRKAFTDAIYYGIDKDLFNEQIEKELQNILESLKVGELYEI